MLTQLDDEILVTRAAKDAGAFAELYRRHITQVYRYHLAHTGNIADAEDLTSQTFMAALDGLAGYRRAGSFIAWLMGIARRQMALFFRQRKPEVGFEQVDSLASRLPSVDLLVGRRISFQQAREALKKINPERAEALILTLFGGLSLKEAALSLGKSEAAIKMLISRGLQDLRSRSLLALEVEA
jgi:RNA polymerase sigma-70 factor (ECF subfamily)